MYLPTHPINNEYIKEWLIIGPFLPADLETDFLADVGGEANIQPREGDAVITSDVRRLKWQRYCAKGHLVELADVLEMHENTTTYAACILRSETASEGRFHFGRGKSVAIWVNGRQVFQDNDRHIFRLDKYVFDVNLKSGDNRLLLKLIGRRNFAIRVEMLPLNRAILSGQVTDTAGAPLSNANVSLEQNGKRVAETQSDDSGNYRLEAFPVRGPFDLSATHGNLGTRLSDLQLQEGERRRLYLILKGAVSIEGTVLMLDDTTPHASIVVEAMMIHGDDALNHPVATTLTDESGKYRFVNLKPGRYQVRCQALGGHIYYQRTTKDALGPFVLHSFLVASRSEGDVLQVESDNSLKNIDFRFPPFKKGTWKNYSYLDGLGHNQIWDIYQAADGMMWFATEHGVSRMARRLSISPRRTDSHITMLGRFTRMPMALCGLAHTAVSRVMMAKPSLISRLKMDWRKTVCSQSSLVLTVSCGLD